MAKRTEKQHMVPRFYLDRFCDTDGRVWSYSANAEPYRRVPTETAVENNFYSPIREDGERNDHLDALLGKIEFDAAPLWDALLQGSARKGDDRKKIALFIAAQYLRSPATVRAGAELVGQVAHQRAHFIAADKNAHDQAVDRLEAETGQTIDPARRERLRDHIINPDNLTLNVLRSEGLRMMGALEDITNILYDMKWVVGRSKDQHLITSDSPVTRHSNPATHHPICGDGAFMNQSVKVQFPLSPSRMLEMSWQGEEREHVVEIPKQLARKYNGNRAAQAHRFVYSSQKDAGIQSLCDKWLAGKKAPSMVTNGRTPKIKIKRTL